MRIFYEDFKNNFPRYIIQCIIASLWIFFTHLLINSVSNMTVIASLGASVFIALTMPHTNASRPRYLIGGYAVGSLCGIAAYYANRFLPVGTEILGQSPHVLICALSAGAAMLIMTAVNLEHPPAAALAMGLVIEENAPVTALMAIVSVISISVFKSLTGKWLRNLL